MITLFWVYYIICVIYCFWRLTKSWNKNVTAGGIGIAPGLDSIMIFLMAWILAPVDISVTWIEKYRERSEDKNGKVF